MRVQETRTRLRELRRVARLTSAELPEPEVQAQLQQADSELTEATADFAEALARSGGRVARPEDLQAGDLQPSSISGITAFLNTEAPYAGRVGWGSPLLWGGGLLMVLPLWVIFLVQATVARRSGATLIHSTAVDGGLLQLYFAGALSFMPLTSDVYVEGALDKRGKVAVAGLLVPTLIGCLLWASWKVTGESMGTVLLAADAFLLYPMVQVFPMQPLDGSNLWEWRKGLWLSLFVVILVAFVTIGSEGLKHVI